MPFYVWWAIPVVATLLAVAWLSWRARERQIDPHDSVAERRRFIAAMEQPPARRSGPTSGSSTAGSPESAPDDAAASDGTTP